MEGGVGGGDGGRGGGGREERVRGFGWGGRNVWVEQILSITYHWERRRRRRIYHLPTHFIPSQHTHSTQPVHQPAAKPSTDPGELCMFWTQPRLRHQPPGGATTSLSATPSPWSHRAQGYSHQCRWSVQVFMSGVKSHGMANHACWGLYTDHVVNINEIKYHCWNYGDVTSMV